MSHHFFHIPYFSAKKDYMEEITYCQACRLFSFKLTCNYYFLAYFQFKRLYATISKRTSVFSIILIKNLNYLLKLVTSENFEISAFSMSMKCSSSELTSHYYLTYFTQLLGVIDWVWTNIKGLNSRVLVASVMPHTHLLFSHYSDILLLPFQKNS